MRLPILACTFGLLLGSYSLAQDSVESYVDQLPKGETAVRLFNGKDLTGWQGDPKRWSVSDGSIRGANDDSVPSSTYLFTEKKYRNFRLLLDVKQTMSPEHSTMHSAVCILGEQFKDTGENEFGFKGPLVMFCHDWGIWDAYGRNRVVDRGEGPKVEKKGDWNLIEVLVIGDRIRCVANGTLVFDFTDKPENLQASPIGLQLHKETRPQEYHFRGLVLAENPEDTLVTLKQRDIRTQAAEIAPSIVLSQEKTEEAPEPPKDLFAQGPKPHWVWGPNNDAHYIISTKFQAENAKRVAVKASCDNFVTLKLNGKQIASSSEWQAPVEKDLTKLLQSGENELTAEVGNEGGVAAFIASIAIEGADGKVSHIVSSTDWTAADRDSKEQVALQDRGELGVGPWNNVFQQPANDSGIPRDTFVLLPGFQVEKLFTVPKEEFGSWVNITTDPKGRIIASDQGDKGLYRITPASGDKETVVEKLPLNITSAQGLLFAFDALYISVNGGPGSGLYRSKYDVNADTFGDVEKLHSFQGGGEHGPHALRLSPDGKRIYVIAGNHTDPPFQPIFDGEPQTMGGARETVRTATLPEGMTSHMLPNWDEDLLLTRQWDANGHARGKLAPGGWIASTDPDGKTWDLFSIGYRNPFDMAFNADGELFAYDADMEWDVGSPWYRPTRVVHATSGSEFGWRSGTGKWPTYYLDSLPPLVNIGPGSPVGVEFGYGTKFPAKYQKALYICDWTFGTMYAIHITPDGSTYKGEKEEFLSRTPLPLTDVTVGHDGALYFTIGGRGTQSELYRVTYVGEESTEPADLHDAEFATDRASRHQLEEYHRPGIVETLRGEKGEAFHKSIVNAVNSDDRNLRFAARLAVERMLSDISGVGGPPTIEPNLSPIAIIESAVALAHVGSSSGRDHLLNQRLLPINFSQLTESQQLDYLRALSLVFIRLGAPDDATRQKFVDKLDPLYPSKSHKVNQELCQMLVYLQSPTVVEKTIGLLKEPSGVVEEDLGAVLSRNAGYGGAIKAMLANQPDKPRVAYALALREAKVGWTIESRKAYFEFLDQAKQWSGGNSYRKFIQNIDDEAFLNATELERLAIEAGGARKPFQMPELPKPAGPGKEWTLEEVRALAAEGLKKGRNFENGQKMFAATRCVLCHRFGGDGGATGPDLTQLAGRFNLEALTEAIMDPSKVISDQYRAHLIAMEDGTVVTGRIVSETPLIYTVVTDPEDSTKVVDLHRSKVEEMKPAPQSLMPAGLLKPLNETEVLDLLAYLLSRGNPGDAMFRK
ncbi:MAG: DUF1080 domain-containing protein [Planctomycetaceae bacterium]|nr:DUF1080 domain-containing protein [Planctomycetaceae bacterium]